MWSDVRKKTGGGREKNIRITHFVMIVSIILPVVAPTPGNRKGGFCMSGFSFVISVMAGVVANYISKWLDGNNSDN